MSKLFKVTLNNEITKELPTLHNDDTIDTLKRKILMAFNGEIPYDSLYIYTFQKKKFIPEMLFKELSQNGKLPITYDRMFNFLLNFKDKSILEKLVEKPDYKIDDIYNLQLDKEHIVYVPVGQTFKGHKSLNYPYVVDPLLLNEKKNEDLFLLENAQMMVSTTNSSLIMDIGNIEENVFYVITAEFALTHMKSKNLNTNIPIYYPFLNQLDIDSLSTLESEREKLLDKNRDLLSNNVEKVFKSVDLFYDLYNTSPYPVTKEGVIEYDIIIHQTVDIILPLEQLFKILHATKDIPFVKFNPGFKRENLLRLYSEEKTIEGTKIPFLSKAMIIKLIKLIGKSNTISMYLDSSIICSIFENGSIRIIGESSEPLSIDDISEKMRLLINPILEVVQKYVQESGFAYDMFTSFEDENIEVITMTYSSTMTLENKLSMKPYMSCISAIFNVTQDTITKKSGIQMRYKRVANYNEMSAIDAFIREVINKGEQRDTIISKIKENFSLSEEKAEEKFIAFINEVDVEQTIFQNRKLRIRDNPGFATTIDRQQFTSNIIITVRDINNVQYVDIIKTYLSSLLTIIQGKEEGKTKELCTKKPLLEESVVPEIVTQGEKPFGENKTPEITAAKELVFEGEDGDDDMLDMLLGSDTDETEDEDESAMSGGAKTPPASKQDITGMSLSNPNYFSKRMEERDPSLFLKKKTGNFNAYSRMCPSNIRRQPVILTEEEKERIDETHPDSYTHSIKYGSDPENPYYYICPRYWCIPENTSLSEDEVKAGVCGGEDAIIPFDAKKVPKGKTIYEFGVDKSNKSAHAYKEFYDEDGNYITHYPGFISGKKHPEGKCMPCCFKSWTATEQVRRRQECSQETTTKKVKLPKKRVQTETQRDYIKGEEKFPLEQERWGYLPIELQMFFGEDSKKYQVSALNPVLKDDAVTLLRQGVERSINQSFIACIADIYSDYSNDDIKQRIDKQLKILRRQLRTLKKTKSDSDTAVLELTNQIRKVKAKPTIKEMKQHIISMLSIDNFTNYQNGNLIVEFYNEEDNSDVSIDDYQDSLMYKQLDTTNEDQVSYMEYVINSFQNFIKFLSDDDIVIDYQYLWDIICMPNELLFTNGINLVIFEIPSDDVTGNVEIICPTNHYSQSNFSDKKLSLMLVKKDGFFEPIYLYDNSDKKVSRFLFREQNLKGNPNIKVALTKVREYLNSRCKPLSSLPNIYFFETNKPLDEVMEKLTKHITNVDSIVIHYNGKAIGVNVELVSGEKGFIPCYPSNHTSSDIPFIFMDDTSKLNNYTDTILFLNKVNKISKLPTKPVCKLIEDNMIIGILTKTNQVVPLKNPENIIDDDLDICQTSYSLNADKTMVTSNKVDNERTRFTNALNIENKSYTAFRNQARIELNMYKNQTVKNKILDLIENENRDSLESYTSTLQQIVAEFRKLLSGMIRFEDNTNLDDLVFPMKNFLTGKDNESGYYLRLADEALRYQRIKLFLFEKNKYLSFSDTVYKINNDEILILESLISQEYFEGLKAFRRNMYVHNNTFDTALPLLTKKYSDNIALQKCIVKTKRANTGIIKSLFGDGYFAKEYGDFKAINRSPLCSFDLMISIMKNEGQNIDILGIKDVLVKLYSEIQGSDNMKLLAIMSSEGKEQWIQNIKGNRLSLDAFIMSENYFLTMIDIWILSIHFNLPIVFLGKAVMKINGKMAYAVNPKQDHYYFVRIFSSKRNTLPRYNLVESPESLIKIPYSSKQLPKVYFELERDIKAKKREYITIDEYIKNFNIK